MGKCPQEPSLPALGKAMAPESTYELFALKGLCYSYLSHLKTNKKRPKQTKPNCAQKHSQVSRLAPPLFSLVRSQCIQLAWHPEQAEIWKTNCHAHSLFPLCLSGHQGSQVLDSSALMDIQQTAHGQPWDSGICGHQQLVDTHFCRWA